MIKRRQFLKSSVSKGISLMVIPGLGGLNFQTYRKGRKLKYQLKHDIPTKLYDGKKCWVHPRAGIIPKRGKKGKPKVLFTMNTHDISGSDVFKGMYGFHTDDLGKSYSEPIALPPLNPRFETIEGKEHPVAASDFWPAFHSSSRKLLGIGHTVVYTPEWKVMVPRPRHTSYAVYDEKNDKWGNWKKLQMPGGEQFYFAGAGSVQRYDESDGTILLPIYFNPHPNGRKRSDRVAVLRCSFNGENLIYQMHGQEISIEDNSRGLQEPSLTKFKGKYYLTMRNDHNGYVSKSQDGLNFEPIVSWKFDDGSDLGNYNTQQHWVTHSEGLFLVYTRKGADNDHVFRHRAPLFMAQVDPDKLCVIWDTERIIVEERGARLGNFGVTNVSPNETWVTVAEWMQFSGKVKTPTSNLEVKNYGSDGSVWVAKINWNQPNKYFKT
ncbi:exo-alpha-sialidase [Cyclobacterium qasimii]|nr:exo-alpha-sialidase [Cyclobacterium qasimii]